VWQKFHILSRAQVFVVATVCGIVIALAVALASIPTDGTSWHRFLGPSRQLDPLINFGLAFVSVLPVFLGYYHLSRIGAFLGLAVSAVTIYVTALCAMFLFTFQMFGRSEMLEAVAYVGFCLLLSALFLAFHMRASHSRAIRNAQRSLRLLHPPQAL
jgi:energy-converting hydrogenase Eha subunit A